MDETFCNQHKNKDDTCHKLDFIPCKVNRNWVTSEVLTLLQSLKLPEKLISKQTHRMNSSVLCTCGATAMTTLITITVHDLKSN